MPLVIPVVGVMREFRIEYCQNCSQHQWSTRHVEAKYYEYFMRVKDELEAEFPGCSVEAVPGLPRCGAFEVTSARGLVFFSKLASNKFPRAGIFKQLVTTVEEMKANSRLSPARTPFRFRPSFPSFVTT